MFVTNWISTTKIQKISEITNFFRHYFLSRTEVYFNGRTYAWMFGFAFLSWAIIFVEITIWICIKLF